MQAFKQNIDCDFELIVNSRNKAGMNGAFQNAVHRSRTQARLTDPGPQMNPGVYIAGR